MGVKVGYYYKCNKCGTRLNEDIMFLSHLLNPIKFGYLVKECPKCGTKYKTNNMEFFSVTNKERDKMLIASLITWILLIDMLVIGICSFTFEDLDSELGIIIILGIDAIFSIFHFLNFRRRWKKALEESIKRFNDATYIFELLITKIIELNLVEESYKIGIISEKTYKDVIYDIDNIKIMT